MSHPAVDAHGSLRLFVVVQEPAGRADRDAAIALERAVLSSSAAMIGGQ
jgi:hypothetical protein